MGAHTNGPWAFGRMLDPANAPAIIGDGDTVVAILPGKWNGCSFIRPDANLIAAAPCLLEALERLTESADDTGFTLNTSLMDGAINVARAAIAKAKGESHG